MIGRDRVLELIAAIMRRQGKQTTDLTGGEQLREIGFRSLDFSELCLRIEEDAGRELSFEAATLRSIRTVEDVCAFIAQATGS